MKHELPAGRYTMLGAAALFAGCALTVLGCSPSAPEHETRRPAETGSSDAGPAPSEPIAVWLDVDPAIGIPNGEVDDGLAMIQAFDSPEIEVRGVSVVFGNAPLAEALPIAKEVVGRFGPSGLAVAAGASGADHLGEDSEAVRAMAAALEREPLTVLALGPVTNVASLLVLHPELHQRIDRIVVVAGRRVGQSFRTGAATNLPHRDFNFELDAPAMQVLLDSDVPLELAPWEVSSHVWLRQADLDDLAGRSERGRWIAETVASWIARWRENLGVDGFNPFDTLAVGWVTHPELIEAVDVGIWIEDAEDDRAPGSGELKPYLLVDPERQGGRRALYTFRPDPQFQPLLKERLAGPAESD